jgi:hypothetical protein
MLAVGYSNQSKSFIVRNSWGEDWVNQVLFRKNTSIEFYSRVIKDIVIFHMII